VTTHTLFTRQQRLANTDPQRRCYNGCHFSSELQWQPWVSLHSGLSAEKAAEALKYWQELNDYAVSQRGESARREFKIEPTGESK
jgi:uncharacterized protein YhdP